MLLPLARMHPDAPVPAPLERPVQRCQPAPLAAYHQQRGEALAKAIAVLAQPLAATLTLAATTAVAVAAALGRPDVRGAKHGVPRAQRAERKVTRVREGTHQRRPTRRERRGRRCGGTEAAPAKRGGERQRRDRRRARG